jgi:hypothetical protein
MFYNKNIVQKLFHFVKWFISILGITKQTFLSFYLLAFFVVWHSVGGGKKNIDFKFKFAR